VSRSQSKLTPASKDGSDLKSGSDSARGPRLGPMESTLDDVIGRHAKDRSSKAATECFSLNKRHAAIENGVEELLSQVVKMEAKVRSLSGPSRGAKVKDAVTGSACFNIRRRGQSPWEREELGLPSDPSVYAEPDAMAGTPFA